ncbi:MAG: O-antigen ligase [Capsulimonadales bacterium]|nr:O-antigen ligase [Capsulimonadales bacterium]
MNDPDNRTTDPRQSGQERRRPAAIDPWEARERERERFRRGRSSRRPRPDREEVWSSADFNFRENFLVFGILLTIVLLIGSGMARFSDANRYLMLQVGTFLVLLLLGTCRSFQENVFPALGRDPNPWLLGLTVWTGIAFALSPYRNFAATEMLRVISGVGVYFVTAYTLRSPRQVSFVLSGILGLGVLLSLYDLSQAGKPGAHLNDMFSLLGTHEHAGSVLTLLLPVALVFAIHPDIEEKRRLAATAAGLILAVALLSSRFRSGWVATLLAVLILAILHFRYFRSGERDDRPDRRPAWQKALLSPVVQVLVALTVFLVLTNLAPLVSQRASLLNLRDDAAFAGRLSIWEGTIGMIRDRPLLGWGLGSFPVLQGWYTHIGDDMAVVLAKGTTHDNNAHSYYLQWTAEAGLIGLFLHIGVLASFVLTALYSIPRLKTPFQTALISGTLAAVLASLVDSLSSPMYHFAGIQAIQYAWIGLGIAAIRPIPRTGSAPGPTTLHPSLTYRIGGALAALLTVGAVGFWVWRTGERHRTMPPGTFQIIAEPIGPVAPGTTVYWRAVFSDAQGIAQPTLPGTLWTVQGGDSWRNADQELREIREAEPIHPPPGYYAPRPSPRQSLFSVLIPGEIGAASVRVKATYRDRYGRIYEAWSEKSIRSRR